jgi:hypothetical protein
MEVKINYEKNENKKKAMISLLSSYWEFSTNVGSLSCL